MLFYIVQKKKSILEIIQSRTLAWGDSLLELSSLRRDSQEKTRGEIEGNYNQVKHKLPRRWTITSINVLTSKIEETFDICANCTKE